MTTPLMINNIQLALHIDSRQVPAQMIEFNVAGDAVEIDTISRVNAGWLMKAQRFGLTVNVLQASDDEQLPEILLEYQLKRTMFTTSITKESGGKWGFDELAWNNCVITAIRGTGMSADGIHTIVCTIKALEMILNGTTYGHTLNGEGITTKSS